MKTETVQLAFTRLSENILELSSLDGGEDRWCPIRITKDHGCEKPCEERVPSDLCSVKCRGGGIASGQYSGLVRVLEETARMPF